MSILDKLQQVKAAASGLVDQVKNNATVQSTISQVQKTADSVTSAEAVKGVISKVKQTAESVHPSEVLKRAVDRVKQAGETTVERVHAVTDAAMGRKDEVTEHAPNSDKTGHHPNDNLGG